MKQVVVSPTKPLVSTEIVDVEIPSPGDDQILIQVIIASSNPKDFKHLYVRGISVNSGDDVAGYVHAMGNHVALTNEFKIGDRVAAFHPMLTPGGAYAEYALVPAATTFLIPKGVSFESAATIPLTSMAAALPLFRRQELPAPWMKRSSNEPPLPLIIYGASSALGTFAVKLARHANIHPIIAIAGSSASYVTKFLDESKGDTVIDYRQGPDKLKAAIKAALKGLNVYHALDCFSENKSWVPLSQVMSPGGTVSVFQGIEKYDELDIPSNVRISFSLVGTAHTGAFLPNSPRQPADPETVRGDTEFAYVFYRYVSRMLSTGEFEGHPYEIIPGGLNGVRTGLQKLQRGEAKGVKYVYQVGE
ncbi:putative quinone oxidoreductase [Talaromyces proteolyticus]|uniref:Quinone oxidoreductase n=1 Tax=Talaromyces proteolyticus TaxID=1131652 RepID=A0AAD4KFG0_9EURO|nr:putative quinone oxidoreductase [Talaromyces proteolyticus]KAH8690717.1 putative quinone oxidoreductase [Talaromyces proteolyticus]